MTILSERLHNVAELVTPGLSAADIGCDHGYLSIYLVENKLAEHVIATDINQGPLRRAKENIRKAGLSEMIETRLSDGLKKLAPGEADCLIMAGMGGRLMSDIIRTSPAVCEKAAEIILQPQSEIAGVRHFLEESGYLIISESMVYEDGKYYQMMKAVHGAMHLEREIYYKYGKILLHEENPVLHQFLVQEKKYYVDLYKELAAQDPTTRVSDRLIEVEKELEIVREALNRSKESPYEMP
ncbi:MAG TPA: class I SAM-dependent methyltransferase [Lachnospiraceae bacterium]|nr:class I SAM-dependent methyltransferase [Lachnospiraceae bacterium]